jgi:hypothetical protein
MAARRVDGFPAKVKRVLTKALTKEGVKPSILSERVTGTRFVRLVVVASKFARMGYSERQSVVWRILQEDLEPEERRRISMVLTLTPTEYGRQSRVTRRAG